MIGYAKYFDSNKTMSFKASDKKLLKKIMQKDRKKKYLFNEKKNLIVSLFTVIVTNIYRQK